MITILSLILFLCVLVWDILSDYRKWLLHIPVKHTKEALIRIGLLLPATVLLASAKDGFGERFWYSVVCIILSALLYFAIWWELFDGMYNKLRGSKWRFNGTVDKDDSKLDKFLYHIGDFWEGVLKIGLIILFMILYILI